MQIYKKIKALLQFRQANLFGALFILSISLSSCYKQKDTILTIVVKDANGTIVEGALVEVTAEPTSVVDNLLAIDLKESTNELGVASFNFNKYYKSGQTGVAILKVEAKLFGKYGSGIVTIEQETVTDKIIVIN
ncbi:MAG: hypothetical protein EBU01_03945 [Crocinitomicaceae bacterium]|jgi:hypothetical protein|nr:hypothetical protein [Crocinitomicaceae bacterium]NCA19839.1 hypothetical protein [Crocinitomicaceae bacterium]